MTYFLLSAEGGGGGGGGRRKREVIFFSVHKAFLIRLSVSVSIKDVRFPLSLLYTVLLCNKVSPRTNNLIAYKGNLFYVMI